MYLYFDKLGVLKEIINDEALRQGNYGVNKLYIYIERDDVENVDVSYLLPSTLIVGPQNYETTETSTIPYNAKRDLKYFKYGKSYTFFVVDLEEDINGNGPLDETGVVHCSLSALLSNNTQLQLGEVNFNVELNAVLNQKYVASQEYLSLSDYLFLRNLIQRYNYTNYVPKYSVDITQWDTTPTNASNKPVTSNGIYNSLMIEIGYSELQALKNSSSLRKGQLYRITDYLTDALNENTISAGHQFDLIVRADNENTINENAHAILHADDTYFSNSDLNAWEIKYNFDTNNIYYMKDEFNNEAPYDFKNIMFLRSREWLSNHRTWIIYSIGELPLQNYYFYTFSYIDEYYEVIDMSLNGNAKNNTIKALNNVFLNASIFSIATMNVGANYIGFDSENNTFGNNAYGIIINNNCSNNLFGADSSYITLSNNNNDIYFEEGTIRNCLFECNVSYLNIQSSTYDADSYFENAIFRSGLTGTVNSLLSIVIHRGTNEGLAFENAHYEVVQI